MTTRSLSSLESLMLAAPRPNTEVADLIDSMAEEHWLPREGWATILRDYTEEDRLYAATLARAASQANFGNEIYMRALLEFSNYCKNNCYYCGIRAGNKETTRYRLTPDEILAGVLEADKLGYRTVVLQSGDDPWFTQERMVTLIQRIRTLLPDIALTLSLGERPREDYVAFFEAGAERYLLRQETSSPTHYSKLHPVRMSMHTRHACLHDLREIGYQTGAGFMVGSPGQGIEELAEDYLFIQDLKPHMIGIGPFLPHHATPFKDEPAGSFESTLFCVSLLRLLDPELNLPATTAMGTIRPTGREQAILSGANVLMPNLTPTATRPLYTLYDNKICLDDDAETSQEDLSGRLRKIGYIMSSGRGDSLVS